MPSKTLSKTRINFISNSCHVCKAANPTVHCEICELIFYCSSAHRIAHWQAHTHLCRAVYKICQREKIGHLYEAAVGMSSEFFRSMRHKAAADCVELLGRPLDPWELEIIYHPKICNTCYAQTDLSVCEGCKFVYTCPKKHFQANHAKWCSTMKMYCDIVKFLNSNDMPLLEDISLSSMPTSITEILSHSSMDTNESMETRMIIDVFTSEIATYPLTVLLGLKTESLSKATVHLVGAELQAEVHPTKKWETYLLHLLPSCKSLHLVFVGPDLRAIEDELLRKEFAVCQKCRDAGKSLTIELIPGTLYHDYLKADDVTRPDLVTTLNAGLYRSIGYQGSDSWQSTLERMFLKNSPPVLITEYTSNEINRDKKLLVERFPDIKFYQAPDVNPYSSMKPSLNVISDDEIPVIFKNYYYMIVSS